MPENTKIQPASEEQLPIENPQPDEAPSERYAPLFESFVELNGNDDGYAKERQAWADDAAQVLRETLLQHHIEAVELGHALTPNGCLVRFEEAVTLTPRAVRAIKKPLRTSTGLKVLYAQPAVGEFRILLKSPTRETVSMWSIWKKRQLRRDQAGVNMAFAIGLKEEDNGVLYLNPIEHEPHTLVAGGAGSGKTTLVQTLLLDIAATNPSSLMRFCLIDPKRSEEYSAFDRVPHMIGRPIGDKIQAMSHLQHLIDETIKRLYLFRRTGSANLAEYNSWVSKDNRLPVLWLVHEAFETWLADKDYADMLRELLSVIDLKARTIGIHLVLIAETLDEALLPTEILDHLGNRLALKLPTKASSERALGENGAEGILGKGHMAARLSNTVVYAQAPCLGKEDELEHAIDIIVESDKQW